MKKIFGILAVSAFLFAACGGNTTETPAEEVEAPVAEEVVVPQEEEATIDTTAQEDMAATEETATEEVAA